VSRVVVGEVLKARGVKGELLVRPTTASIERFLSIRSVWLEKAGRESKPHGDRRPLREDMREVEPQDGPQTLRDGKRETESQSGQGQREQGQSGWNFLIEGSKIQGELVLVKLQGIDSREEATRLNGSTLEIPRSEVPPHPEGEHYMFELVGMKVTRTDGIELGSVTDVMETGSNIVYVVKDALGKETLVPATRDVVEKLDYKNSQILVRPVPGLFDE